MGLVDRLQAEWPIIEKAWLSLSLIAIALVGATWALVGWLYRHQIANLKERIALKDDRLRDYEKKLDGASPEEAKDRLDALEKLVAHLKPRELTAAKRATLTDHLRKCVGKVLISYAMTDGTSREYAEALAEAFKAARWDVQDHAANVASWNGLPTIGLRVFYPMDQPETEAQLAVLMGLKAAGIAYEPLTRQSTDYDIAISVTPKMFA